MHAPNPPADASVAWCAQLVERLLQCSQLLRDALQNRLKSYQLRDIHFLLLWRCGRAGEHGIAQLDLAATLAASPAQISALVEQLRHRGLLAAHRPPGDRRRQHWQLTTGGRVLLDELIHNLQPWAEQLRSTCAQSGDGDPLAALWSLLDGPSGENRLIESIGFDDRKRGAA